MLRLRAFDYVKKRWRWIDAPSESGEGLLPDPFVITGTDPNEMTMKIEGAVNQQSPIFEISTEPDGHSLISVASNGEGGPGDINFTGSSGSLFIGEIISLVGSMGFLIKPPLVEPSDALLNQFGRVLIWTTNTTGASKLHFKMLNSDEVVVKGEISLTA